MSDSRPQLSLFIWVNITGMKRTIAAALFPVLVVVSAAAQKFTTAPGSVTFKGTPASVTSIGGNKTFAGGVPASVTSIAPSFPFGSTCTNPALIPAALGCTNPAFTPTVNFTEGRVEFGRRFNLRRHHGGFVPVIVPYAYPVTYPMAYEPQPTQPVQVDIHIEDRRGRRDRDDVERHDLEEDTAGMKDDAARYGTHDLDSRERRARTQGAGDKEPRRDTDSSAVSTAGSARAAGDEAPREIISTVLVFRDGHREEVQNYAIVGKVLFDFGDMKSHKIQLAELDLPATVRENEERGVEFNVPRGVE